MSVHSQASRFIDSKWPVETLWRQVVGASSVPVRAHNETCCRAACYEDMASYHRLGASY